MNAYSGNNKGKENKIKDEIGNHNIQISQLLAKIKDENSNKEKKRLYEEILQLNNVEKQYIFPYLLLIKEMFSKKEISSDEYENLLKKYDIYTQNEQYTKNSEENNTKKDSYMEKDSQNIKEKIKGFLESLKDKSDLYNSDGKSCKMQFINLIFESVKNINDINYKAIKRVTWENNQELYLYILYCSLVCSLYNRIEYYINKDSKNERLLEMGNYIKCINDIESTNEEIKTIEEKKIKIKEEIKKIEESIKVKIKKIKEEIKVETEKKNKKIKETETKIETEVEKKNKKEKEEIKKIKETEAKNKKKGERARKIKQEDLEEQINLIKEEIKKIKEEDEVEEKENNKNIKEEIKILEANFEEKAKQIKNLDELKIENERKKSFLENTRNTIILMEGPFFTRFISNLTTFLNEIEENYNKRFKDLEIKNNDDKILFEYYLLFIGNTDFSETIYTLSDMWNEFFAPLNDDEIQKKINILNKDEMDALEINFNRQKRVIEITIMYEKIIIENIDNYAIIPLINDIIKISIDYNLEWSLTKYLRPTKYKDNLFIYKIKNIWQNLIFKIFNSNAYNSIKFSFYDLKQIDFLSDQSIFLDIIDNIQFFTFNCIFNGNTISELYRIYENALFSKFHEKSVSLLIFYSFFIITNLHEIGGHFYVRFQYFYSLNEGFESPNINESEKPSYSVFGNLRGKESGERLEIKLFGRVINKLTINEALYILNINNYNQNIKEFQKNFYACNSKSIGELIDNSLEMFLTSLSIKKDDLLNRNYIGQYYSILDFNPNKELEKNEYYGYGIYSKHSLGLFEAPDEKKINGMLEIMKDFK